MFLYVKQPQLNLVDEYDGYERLYLEPVEGKLTEDISDKHRTYELSQVSVKELKSLKTELAGTAKSTLQPKQIPYRHLVTLIQINDSRDWITAALTRTNIITELDDATEKRLHQRLQCAKFWLENFAPEVVKFAVQDEIIPDLKNHLDEAQLKFLTALADNFEGLSEWDAEAIHNTIHVTSKEIDLAAKSAFQALYWVIIGQERGPRLGYFLSSLDKEFVINRLKEASEKS